MVRRKRQRKFTWMPTIGAVGQNVSVDQSYTFLNALTVPANGLAGAGTRGGVPAIFIVPVIQDKPLEPGAQNEVAGSLNNVVGNEWFCERIVGDIFVGTRLGVTEDQGPRTIAVTCGFFVARAGDTNQNLPIGATNGTAAETHVNYSPAALNAVREPWMWRRTWVLGRTFNESDGLAQNPSVNSFYATLANGPHVDCKSVRRIGNDERLWFAVTCTDISIGFPNPTEAGLVDVMTDLRVLGALRKPRNRSTF